MAMAFPSLVGVLLACYRYFPTPGLIRAQACGSGGCGTVQFSPGRRFLGMVVPPVGAGGYLAPMILGVLSVPQPTERRWAAHATSA